MGDVMIHPKFLHSNASSHEWALRELLDNSFDKIYHGATLVNVDTLENKKYMRRMLLVEDDGMLYMAPDRMRHCMSHGHSAKNKSANTIGQYGNGFKTSTMRLEGDVIVFSRYHGKDGKPFVRACGRQEIYIYITDRSKSKLPSIMLDNMES